MVVQKPKDKAHWELAHDQEECDNISYMNSIHFNATYVETVIASRVTETKQLWPINIVSQNYAKNMSIISKGHIEWMLVTKA